MYEGLLYTYFATEYMSKYNYNQALDKYSMVDNNEKYYSLLEGNFNDLNALFGITVSEKAFNDVYGKANSIVSQLEKSFDSRLYETALELITSVPDEVKKDELMNRLEVAKQLHEENMKLKEATEAVNAVDKAKETKNQYHINIAYQKVNEIKNDEVKRQLIEQLKELEQQISYEKKLNDAIRTVELAEQFELANYITLAQDKINALPENEDKTSLQDRLDIVKEAVLLKNQAQYINQAENYIRLASIIGTQSYIDKAQEYIDLILDDEKKAELQAKLDSMVE